MEKGLVSVVIPIYNVEKYLDCCVTSIVNQTYQKLEIILVDDGSPDSCPQLCEKWAQKDPRIKVVHKTNEGLGMARNTGMEHATGEYICFFDSDDYVALDTIEKAYRQIRDQEAEIVVFGKQSVGKDGTISKCLTPKADKLRFEGEEVQTVFLPDFIDNRHPRLAVKELCFSSCTCLYSMDLIERTAWRFVSERQNISEDSYSLIWLYQYVRTVTILPEALYFYRENETSLTRTYRKDRYEKIKKFYEDCLQLAQQANYSEKVQKRISGLYLSLTIAAMKQITAAQLPVGEKYRLLKQIVKDETMQLVIAAQDIKMERTARKILLLALRCRVLLLVFLLVKLQSIKRA